MEKPEEKSSGCTREILSSRWGRSSTSRSARARSRSASARRNALALLAPAALAGCAAPGYWLHPEHQEQARFQRDASQCVYESGLATANAPASIFLSQQLAQDVATGVRRGELQRLCMQARGYYWQTATPGVSPMVQEHAARAARNTAPANTYYSEVNRFALSAGCSSPDAIKTGNYGATELYEVSCAAGPSLYLRCSAGTCETTNPTPAVAEKPTTTSAAKFSAAPQNRSAAQRTAVGAQCTSSWDSTVSYIGALGNVELLGVRCDDGRIAKYRCLEGNCEPDD